MTELAVVDRPVIVLEHESTTDSIPRRKQSTLLESLTLIHRQLQKITASWEPAGSTLKPRKLHRMRFTEKLILTPICETSLIPQGEPLVIQGHDLSFGGLSFLHRNPLLYKEVAITFLQPDDSCVTIATILKWCRFSRENFYFSGGQFLRSLELEQHTLADIDQLPPA